MDGSFPPSDLKTALSAAQFEALAAELDALRAEVMSQLGERDAKHIRRMVRVARWCAISGRSLLMFGWTPLAWVLGVLALSIAKILENMEIGHNVLHGQYDWMNDPTLNSQTYEWDIVCTGAHWRDYHNHQHHAHTNILGRDHDLGYGMLRVTEKQPWYRFTSIQTFFYGLLAPVFQWGVAVHHMDIERLFVGKMPKQDMDAKVKPFLKKSARQLFKDYVFFPALALWHWPQVLAGNALANLLRNLWTNIIIFCGHFPKGVKVYTQDEVAQESRGQWYVRQMQGSANIEGGRWLHLLSGHLSHQIEHHLFPDMPAHRYPEIAARVRALCRRYGLSYCSGSLATQYQSVWGQMLRHSLPH